MNRQAIFTLKALSRAVALGILTTAALPASATNFVFSDMGTIAKASTTPISVNGINNNGLMSGVIGSNGGFDTLTPGTYDGTTFSPLPNLPGGHKAVSLAINDAGQVSGVVEFIPDQDLIKPVRWDNGSPLALQPLSSDSWFSRPESINASGQMTGFGFTDQFIGARWGADGSLDFLLPTLGGSGSFGQDINDAGETVGDAYTQDDAFDPATYWDANGNVVELQTFGGRNGWATAINSHGEIVGYTTTADNHGMAAYWANAGAAPIALQMPVGSSGAVAADINDVGQILGWVSDGSADGGALYLWENGISTNLEQYLPANLADEGWVMNWYMKKINNDGVIVGTLTNETLNQTASFRLTPTTVPVPGAVWLFGSALAGFVGWSRRNTLAA